MLIYFKNSNLLNNFIFKGKSTSILLRKKKKKKSWLASGDLVCVLYMKGNLLRSFTGFVVFRKRLHNDPFICVRNVYSKSIIEQNFLLDASSVRGVEIIRRRIIRKRCFSLKFFRNKPRRYSKFFRFGYL